MNYLDSSALLKLLFEERESAALATWLEERGAVPSVTSELARVEVLRAARRIDPEVVPAARSLLAGLDLVPLDGAVVAAAAELDDPLLRALDALHLASALALGQDLAGFVAYDRRLAAAAATAGLVTAQPGA